MERDLVTLAQITLSVARVLAPNATDSHSGIVARELEMIRVMSGRRPHEITVSIAARNWEAAAAAMLHCRRNQPDGHTMIAGKIVRRGAKGGQRCQLQIILRHTNPSWPTITNSVGDPLQLYARELFSVELGLAQDAADALANAQNEH